MIKRIVFDFKQKNMVIFESLSDFLLGLGVLSVEVFEDNNILSSLCFEEMDVEGILKKAVSFLEFLGARGFKVKVEDFEEKDWVEEFKRFFKPFDMGKYFKIIPLWERNNKNLYSSNRINIIVEPGHAFGTGLHGTTALCADFLKEYTQGKDSFSMLDAGTGSGILSVIGKKLGAKRITAFDIDPDCKDVFFKHFEINNLSLENVEFFIGTVNSLKKRKYHLVIANIIESVLREIVGDLRQFVGDKLILSGVLEENSTDFETFLEKEGLTILKKRVYGEWAGYLIEVKDAD